MEAKVNAWDFLVDKSDLSRTKLREVSEQRDTWWPA